MLIFSKIISLKCFVAIASHSKMLYFIAHFPKVLCSFARSHNKVHISEHDSSGTSLTVIVVDPPSTAFMETEHSQITTNKP